QIHDAMFDSNMTGIRYLVTGISYFPYSSLNKDFPFLISKSILALIVERSIENPGFGGRQSR
ncbi:MAG: hypothetical protein KAT07_09150, partial [Calditrichia bacterium]|nr:hypothetical protein [Calditrichia bacterium]